MALIVLLLALAYGSPHWTFPWWVWVLAVIVAFADATVVRVYTRLGQVLKRR